MPESSAPREESTIEGSPPCIAAAGPLALELDTRPRERFISGRGAEEVVLSYELLKRLDVELLHPSLVNRVIDMLSSCRLVGFDYWAVSGFRSAPEQQALYEQGRSRPGNIVTSARAFQSAHNFGLAIDFAHDRDLARGGLQDGWSPEEYEVLGVQARAHGLVWGGDLAFSDRPHVQLPGYVTATQLAPLRAVYLDAPERGRDVRSRLRSKLQAVWLHIDTGDAAFA